MRSIIAYLIFFAVLWIAILPAIAEENMTALAKADSLGNNSSPSNNTGLLNDTIQSNNTSPVINMSSVNKSAQIPVIRVGLQTPKSLHNVDVYGNKSLYNISAYSNTKSTYNVSAYSFIKKLHTVTNVVKPLVNVEDRSSTKPFFNASDETHKQIDRLGSFNGSAQITDLGNGSPVREPYIISQDSIIK